MTPPPTGAPARPAPAVVHDGAVVRFAADLARHGTRVALVDGDHEVTYADLADRVERERAALGAQQQLVALRPEATTDFVVAYLAALAGGHAVLLSRHESLAAAYGAGVARDGGGWRRTGATAPDLHPDLRLLLSTSGSTGSPKLVRLSAKNLDANARAIVDYLGITPDDRALLTLPLDYCYGLSVLHSHLTAGAAVVLADGSVSDPALWARARAAGVTSFAGVPYTFELLEKAGWPDLPTLRQVTQAGGRMAPERVRALAARGRRDGWELVVMYGQTEATARIAYLPPRLVEDHPAAIGVPIPGGELRLEPVDGAPDGVGELVYTGPNVMMGYAHSPADLARGHELTELRTGDLARRDDAGLFEVVGRRSRFAKLFGQRIDLDRVETLLAVEGHEVACAESYDAGRLVVAVAAADGDRPDRAEAAVVAADVVRLTGLPAHAVRAVPVAEVPRRPNGKPDHAAVARLDGDAEAAPGPAVDASGPETTEPEACVAAQFATVLGLDASQVRTSDTFAGLGGDSLSYVELALRLEQRLTTLPQDWPTRTVGELAALARTRGRRRPAWVRVETGIVLRAAAIVLIVASHAELFIFMGGAHVLLAVAGANFARFHLSGAVGGRVRRLARSVARIAVPASLWIAAMTVLFGGYGWKSILLLNDVLGSATWNHRWQYWFVEALVYLLLLAGLALSVPRVAAWERRWPFGLPAALLGVALATRVWTEAADLHKDTIYQTTFVAWLFLGGWAAAKASSHLQRLLVTALILPALPGFTPDPVRDAVIAVGVLALVWLPTVPWPRLALGVTGLLASSSLYIYLTNFIVTKNVETWSRLGATVAALAVGAVAWLAVDRVSSLVRHRSREIKEPR